MRGHHFPDAFGRQSFRYFLADGYMISERKVKDDFKLSALSNWQTVGGARLGIWG